MSPDAHAEEKRAAARCAVERLRPGMIVGLGTGSTARFAIQAIGERVAHGELAGVLGVPTSRAARRDAIVAGIPLTTLARHPEIDITIDGADEVDPAGDLIKGAGGALLHEKIVASHSRRLVIVADRSKLVARLGTTHALPVEVVRFGWSALVPVLCAAGAELSLRRAGESPYVTDEGHFIVDARFPGGIDDPAALDRALRRHPGVVETGLFLGFHPEVVTGE